MPLSPTNLSIDGLFNGLTPAQKATLLNHLLVVQEGGAFEVATESAGADAVGGLFTYGGLRHRDENSAWTDTSSDALVAGNPDFLQRAINALQNPNLPFGSLDVSDGNDDPDSGWRDAANEGLDDAANEGLDDDAVTMTSVADSLAGAHSFPDMRMGFETGSDGTISSAMGVELLEVMTKLSILANQERRAQQQFEFDAQNQLAQLAADPFTAIQGLNLGFGLGAQGLPSGFLGELNRGGFPGLSGAKASSNPAFRSQNNAKVNFQAGGQNFEAPRLLSGQQFAQLSSRLPEALDFLTSANRAGGNKAFRAEQRNSLIPTGVFPTAAF